MQKIANINKIPGYSIMKNKQPVSKSFRYGHGLSFSLDGHPLPDFQLFPHPREPRTRQLFKSNLTILVYQVCVNLSYIPLYKIRISVLIACIKSERSASLISSNNFWKHSASWAKNWSMYFIALSVSSIFIILRSEES